MNSTTVCMATAIAVLGLLSACVEDELGPDSHHELTQHLEADISPIIGQWTGPAEFTSALLRHGTMVDLTVSADGGRVMYTNAETITGLCIAELSLESISATRKKAYTFAATTYEPECGDAELIVQTMSDSSTVSVEWRVVGFELGEFDDWEGVLTRQLPDMSGEVANSPTELFEDVESENLIDRRLGLLLVRWAGPATSTTGFWDRDHHTTLVFRPLGQTSTASYYYSHQGVECHSTLELDSISGSRMLLFEFSDTTMSPECMNGVVFVRLAPSSDRLYFEWRYPGGVVDTSGFLQRQ